MEIFEFNERTQLKEPTILVLGYFDGLHRGHQALFKEARDLKALLGLPIVVLTFPEKPVLTFQQFTHEMLLKLSSDDKRAALFEENGVDALYLQAMTSQFAAQTALEFTENVVSKFRPKVVVTGFDYTTGSDMKALKSTDDFRVVVVPEVLDGDEKIGSTRIRQAVKSGNVAEANRLLGWSYETTGLVVHGFARGRELGYPTANLVIKDFVHVPSPGVYVVDVLVEGEKRRGFASIGFNDTFEGTQETLEVHIFDFQKEIYGESLTVYWLDKIRAMQKFDGVESLVAQMKKDEQVARLW
ncbi:MAG: bifunctional riboflavin kinase/FAD synthetase [Streptococcaceae bacterium]|jgi:riboflavin kinase/FMN adenylyltransferase|nr:bifunctional riboflavin kinase/FAD synthetase [Streptococcaceae bacterium]